MAIRLSARFLYAAMAGQPRAENEIRDILAIPNWGLIGPNVPIFILGGSGAGGGGSGVVAANR